MGTRPRYKRETERVAGREQFKGSIQVGKRRPVLTNLPFNCAVWEKRCIFKQLCSCWRRCLKGIKGNIVKNRKWDKKETGLLNIDLFGDRDIID